MEEKVSRYPWECWQLLEEAQEQAPSQEIKDAIANVIDQL